MWKHGDIEELEHEVETIQNQLLYNKDDKKSVAEISKLFRNLGEG